MRISSILTVIIFIVASVLISVAQTPEPVDVEFVAFSKTGSAGLIHFRMEALNSSQTRVIYQSTNSAALGVIPISTCSPCSLPKIYNTNVFGSEISADLGTNVGSVRFYFTTSTSSPLALNQRILSKKRDFSINGTTRLEGRIEVTNASGVVVAVDNNVILEGYYSVLFWKPYISPNGHRLTDFKSLIYSLNSL